MPSRFPSLSPIPHCTTHSAWDAYMGLENTLKNFMTSMPLVSELRSPAMRPHHWKEIQTLSHVEFNITAEFRLSDLLDLNLHKYAEDIMGIVEKAQKEQMSVSPVFDPRPIPVVVRFVL